jgi:hypothetical protein
VGAVGSDRGGERAVDSSRRGSKGLVASMLLSPELNRLDREREERLLVDAAAAVHAESLLLSWRNLAPRGAYLHRIAILTEIFHTLENVLTAEEKNPFSFLFFIRKNFIFVVWYIIECIQMVAGNLFYLFNVVTSTLTSNGRGE